MDTGDCLVIKVLYPLDDKNKPTPVVTTNNVFKTLTSVPRLWQGWGGEEKRMILSSVENHWWLLGDKEIRTLLSIHILEFIKSLVYKQANYLTH